MELLTPNSRNNTCDSLVVANLVSCWLIYELLLYDSFLTHGHNSIWGGAPLREINLPQYHGKIHACHSGRHPFTSILQYIRVPSSNPTHILSRPSPNVYAGHSTNATGTHLELSRDDVSRYRELKIF